MQMTSLIRAAMLTGGLLAPLEAQRLPAIKAPDRRIEIAASEHVDRVFVDRQMKIQREDTLTDPQIAAWAASDSLVFHAVEQHCRVLGYRTAVFGGDTTAALRAERSARQYRSWLCRDPIDALGDRSRGRVTLDQLRLVVGRASDSTRYLQMRAFLGGVEESEDSEMACMQIWLASGTRQAWRLVYLNRALRR